MILTDNVTDTHEIFAAEYLCEIYQIYIKLPPLTHPKWDACICVRAFFDESRPPRVYVLKQKSNKTVQAV